LFFSSFSRHVFVPPHLRFTSKHMLIVAIDNRTLLDHLDDQGAGMGDCRQPSNRGSSGSRVLTGRKETGSLKGRDESR
jgi:hypothetical protein